MFTDGKWELREFNDLSKVTTQVSPGVRLSLAQDRFLSSKSGMRAGFFAKHGAKNGLSKSCPDPGEHRRGRYEPKQGEP